MTNTYRCSTCSALFCAAPRENTAFCPACLVKQREAVAEIDARAARVARGDLNLMHNRATTDAEREEILRARRAGNYFGVPER